MPSRTAPYDQAAYSIWIPRDAKRVLCLAYGAQPSASLLSGLASEVVVDPMCLSARDAFDVVMLIGNPVADQSVEREHARRDFLSTIARAWTCLHSSGRLIVAFDPAAGAEGTTSTLRAWLLRDNWLDVRAIDSTLRRLGANRLTRLHALPSVWRPVLLYTPDSPAPLKRMALAHIGGWRARLIGRALLNVGRQSPMDMCPAGIVWVASR